ncbi:hypothetical protein [Yinghuangia soli]|uniref:Uncharacterized protein n=1 Tax=Yinghuangia soli TaxID=2908204 RepID=A0AA41QBU3_9ACTN|nr:hypothetical protein [Yinghuangia soli]MCF2533994.1 hypothetical protein [Yinghuangia soli]
MTDISETSGPGEGKRKRWVPPTDAHLTTALTAYVTKHASELGNEWSKKRKGELPKKLEALPDPRRTAWKTLLEAWITERLRAFFAEFSKHGHATVAQVIKDLKETQYVRGSMDDADVHPIATEDTIQVFKNYCDATPMFMSITKGLAALTAEVEERTARFRDLEPWLDERVRKHTESCAGLQPLCDEARAAIALADQYRLTEPLQLIIEPLTKHHGLAVQALACTGPALWVKLDAALGAGFKLAAVAQKAEVETVIGKAIGDADTAALQLDGLLWLVTESVLDTLKPLAKMTAQAKTGYTELVQHYKLPFIRCLGTIDDPALMNRVLAHCAQADVRKALKANFAGNCTSVVLSQAFHELVAHRNSQDVCLALAVPDTRVMIPLPGNVTTITQIAIGAVWLPRAFSVGELETDLLCLKHMVEELGVDPSPGKCTAYFAELVAACVEAGRQWRQAGKPQTFICRPIQGAVATWNIKVKLAYRRAQVFHVDSGYSKASPWVNRQG